MSKLFYVPLEGYKERYTMQWSAPVTGWLERNWIKAGVVYHRINGRQPDKPVNIAKGAVLDAVGRSVFCFSQMEELLHLANDGQLTSRDVIYLDDFWTPGLEALPYLFDQIGVHPRIYAFLHAQSVDEFDFTYKMRRWMRPIETGYGNILEGIFVCGPCLRDLVVQGGIAPAEKVHITGHPFNSEEVTERMPFEKGQAHTMERENKVVFSSRWDDEKNPKFFLEVAEKVIESGEDVTFVVCTGSPQIRSNNDDNIEALKASIQKYPQNIKLLEGLSKEEYYQQIATAKVQMNTADQDFVAITLLEASVAGAYPVYPYFRSFPETFLHRRGFMYERLDADHAARMILSVINSDKLWTEKAIKGRAWIHERFDTSWRRQLNVMGLRHYFVDDPYCEQA